MNRACVVTTLSGYDVQDLGYLFDPLDVWPGGRGFQALRGVPRGAESTFYAGYYMRTS